MNSTSPNRFFFVRSLNILSAIQKVCEINAAARNDTIHLGFFIIKANPMAKSATLQNHKYSPEASPYLSRLRYVFASPHNIKKTPPKKNQPFDILIFMYAALMHSRLKGEKSIFLDKFIYINLCNLKEK